MMIEIKKPYGAIAENLITSRFEREGKFYIVDDMGNVFEISEQDYINLKCPVKVKRYR